MLSLEYQLQVEPGLKCRDPPVSHREPAPGVAHGQEGVVVLVAELSGAPGQLRPAPVLAVVVGQGAVVDHG